MKYLFLEGNSAKRMYDVLVTLGDKHPSYCTVSTWVVGFRTGHMSTEDEVHFGRPTQVKIPENMDTISSMILDDREISAKKIAETLMISRERVGYIYYS
jgi:predicted HTH transcriptional regulator